LLGIAAKVTLSLSRRAFQSIHFCLDSVQMGQE
jgi:hypothetical protein